MTGLDWAVVAVYFVGIIGIAVYAGRRNRGMEDFFLAGREMPWWAVGLSVMATQLSAITLVGTTGQGYNDGLRFVQFYYGLPIAMIILAQGVHGPGRKSFLQGRANLPTLGWR